MNERDLWWKIVIVGALAALAFASVWPIDTKIKYGIDLRGGYSLLYEIDDSGLGASEKQDLAERVMRVLRERVDPKGVYNLVWRPVGHNRLEIQMPRPSDQVMAARAEYEQAQEQIQDTLVRRSMILRAISKPPAEREAALDALVHNMQKRRPLLEAAAAAYDAHHAMREAYDARVKQIEADNITRQQIEAAVKSAPDARPAAFEALLHGNADRKGLLEAAAKAWDEYNTAKDAYDAAQANAEGPQEVTGQDVSGKLQAYNRAVRNVLTVNVDPDMLKEGATIDKVVELDEKLDAAIADVLATNIDVGRLQSILDLKPTDALRTEQLSSLISETTDLPAGIDVPTLLKFLEYANAAKDENASEKKLADLMKDVPGLSKDVETDTLLTLLGREPKSKLQNETLGDLLNKTPALPKLIATLVTANDELKTKRRSGEGRLEDPADLQRLLRGAGVLEFRILADPDELRGTEKLKSYVEDLKTRGPRKKPGEQEYQWFEVEDPGGDRGFFHIKDLAKDFEARKQGRDFPVIAERFGDKYYVLSHIGEGYTLTHDAGQSEWSLKSARFDRDQNGRPAIAFTLDERGGAKFGPLTTQHKGRQLAIFLDDMAISHANIMSTIRTHGQITGSFTPLEVQEMVKKLNAGSLPKKLKDPPISIRAIGPSLGEANRVAGLNAAKWAAIAVAIFMLIYYFYAGSIAVIAVGMNILFIGAMMSTLGATLTLPGIAGLVLAIGMAVDANVLINERIREELARGTAMRMAIKLGYERAFRAILDSNVTTVLTCVILYLLGSEDIKGFGLTLGIGVFINIFTAYFVTRMFFELMSMFPVPKEIIKYPIVAAIVIAAFGGLMHAGGYFLNAPEVRDQSVMILFGEAMYDVAIAVIVLLILMQIARAIHGAFQTGGKPRMPMLRLIGSPKIDWVGKRYVFFTLSCILVGGGLLTFFSLSKDQLYDIEFLGGTNAQIELKEPGSLDATDVHNKLIEAGEEFTQYGDKLATATVSGGTDGIFELRSPGVSAAILDPVIKSVMDKKLTQRNAVQYADPTAETLTIRTRPDANMDLDKMKAEVSQFSERLKVAGEALDGALVQAVQEIGTGQEAGESFDIVTRETNKELVVAAIMDSLGDYINVQPALQFHLMTDPTAANAPYFPIRSEDARQLGLGIPTEEAQAIDLRGWQGGVAIALDQIDPPQSIPALRDRLRAMRLQPGFENYGWRESEVFGLHPASAGSNLYSRVLVVVADENYPMEDDQGVLSSTWVKELAEAEVTLIQEALQRQTSLNQITQFDQQVSSEAQTDAYIALALSWLVIIIYVWFRFGNIRWGLAAVAALIHDVIIAAGTVALTYYIADTAIGKLLMLEKFRVDLALVAALLTVIGYSVNDTIVVFDRIRENRGRMTDVTPEMVNASISQTLSRTLLTFLTSVITVIIMYVAGGRGIHAFNYVLFIGLLIGTYSSIGIASQFLLRRRELKAE